MNHFRNIMDRYGLRRRTPATDRTVKDLNVIEFNRDSFCEQSDSPLFSVLPGEIRDRIFAYTLAEFEDTLTAFDSDTCYRRPEYAAPRRSDTALLQTCQRVYHEAFFYPFALAEQILWLAWDSRRPSTVTTPEQLQPSLALMQKLHGDTELDSVRVFAQLCRLESGGALSEILDMPHFLPRSMTVTIRHTGKLSLPTLLKLTIDITPQTSGPGNPTPLSASAGTGPRSVAFPPPSAASMCKSNPSSAEKTKSISSPLK
jgi:hypothetical protein